MHRSFPLSETGHPEGALQVAEALARRDDTAWVSLAGGEPRSCFRCIHVPSTRAKTFWRNDCSGVHRSWTSRRR